MAAKTNLLSQQINGGNLINVDSFPVTGGTLYITSLVNGGVYTQVSSQFVPLVAASPLRTIPLYLGASDLGVPLTATPGTPAGTVGISRTAGTSMALTGETTSANAKTDKVMFELDLPDTYIAGSNIPVVVNAHTSGTGTITAASTTMTVAAYSVSTANIETALAVSAAVQIPATTPTNLNFTITGTGLVPTQRIIIECVMLVTSASGANTGSINSVGYQA